MNRMFVEEARESEVNGRAGEVRPCERTKWCRIIHDEEEV